MGKSLSSAKSIWLSHTYPLDNLSSEPLLKDRGHFVRGLNELQD